MRALLILNKTFFCGIHTSACIVIIFFIIKCLYHRHWILRGNMFNYFCKGSILRIIFTSIYFFNQRLKICINNWQGLSRFSILIKLQYLKSWENHHKNLIPFYLHNFFIWFKFVFVLREWRQFKQQKSLAFFDVIPLNNADYFFYCKIMPSLSIWNQQFEQIDFYDLSCGLKCTQVIFNFLIYNTFINHISQFFSSHLFMMGSLIFDILYGYFLIFSWFNATVPAYWKHLPSPLTELNVACFLSSQENIYMIHHNSYLFYGICNIINKNIDKITTFNWCFSNDLISRKKWFTELFANFICSS